MIHGFCEFSAGKKGRQEKAHALNRWVLLPAAIGLGGLGVYIRAVMEWAGPMGIGAREIFGTGMEEEQESWSGD